VEITATVRAKTKLAVLLDDGEIEDWVPRSCLHGGDDLYLDKIPISGDGEERVFRMRRWQAHLKGFI